MKSQLHCSSIAMMLYTQSVVCVHLPLVISCSRYSYDCIPCNEANINTFRRYHFVSMGIKVDLPVNVKKAVILDILTTFMEELRSLSVNLRTRKRLNAIPFTTTDSRHRVYGLHRQFQDLLQRKGALLPLLLQIILLDIPP